MMRRGYDVHLHYANFGVRKLMFRLPQGLPMNQRRAKEKRLKAIASKPADAVLKAEKLVKARSTDNYYEAASILADLRDALGPEKGPKRANAAAEKLVRAHPTLSYLKKALCEQGLSYI